MLWSVKWVKELEYKANNWRNPSTYFGKAAAKQNCINGDNMTT